MTDRRRLNLRRGAGGDIFRIDLERLEQSKPKQLRRVDCRQPDDRSSLIVYYSSC